MTGGLHAVAETDVYIERLDALVADTARRTAQEGCTPGDECRFGDDGDPSSSLSLVVWALTLPSNAVPQKLHNSIVKKALYILDVRFRLLYRGENLATWISPFLNLYMSLDDTSLHLYNASFPSLPHLMTIPDVPLALKALIWRKALLHKQPTAQKQSIVAFLSADWRGGGSGGGNDSADGGATDGGARDVTTSESTVLSYLVEEDGILESVLIPVLASEKTGRGPVGEEIDGLVDGWYQRVGEDAGVDVWSVLGRVVGVMGEHPGRSVGVLVGCARAVCGMLEGAGRRRDIGGLSEPSRSSLEGRIVRAGLGLRKVCFGSNYGAVRCHESLMRAGRAVWGGRGVVEGMLAYLEVVPLGLLVRGGALHEEAKEMIGCVDAEGERGDGRNRLGWWGDGDVGRRHPAAMWLVLYLRGEAVGEADETEVAGVVRDVATRPSPVSSSETLCPIVLLPCLRLLAEDRKRSSTASRLSACLDRLGLVDVFWAAACGYAKSKLPGAGAVRQLMADARARIEGGDRGGFVDNLEPFFEKAWIELRETLAAQWECVALVADLLKERDPEQEEVLRAQLVESRAVLEAAIDEVLREYDDDAVLEGLENADWHALMEVLLFNTRLLSSVAEAMSSLKTSEASEASKVAKTTDFLEAVTSLMDRGPGTLYRSLRGWFEFSIWRAVNESLASGQTDDATISRLAGMAVAGLAQCRDGDRAVVPIIRCVRTIMPRLVGAEDTFTLSSVGAALLGVCQSHQRRRLGVTAAVVTTLVHPCLYSSSTPRIMRDLAHGFVIGLVDAARRYPRLLVTLSSHLAAVLLKAPGDQRLQYIDVLQELLMSGFDVEEQAVELRNEVLDGSLDDVLSSVPREVARAYRLSECAPRIATLCLMHEWATGSEGYDNQDVQDDVRIVDDTGICGKEVCRRLWKRLLDLARTDKALSQGTYMHGGTLHKRKLRLWQAIATLCPAVPDEDVEATLVVMMELLCSHNHASVRYYMELISLSMVLRRPSLLTTRVFPTLADYSSQRRDDLPSLFCVVGVTLDNLQERGEPSYKDFETAAIEHILPWTGAFPHATRTFSQIILADILQRVGRRQSGDYGRDGKVCGDGLDGNLRRLYEFFQSNADLKKMLTAMVRVLKFFSPEQILTVNDDDHTTTTPTGHAGGRHPTHPDRKGPASNGHREVRRLHAHLSGLRAPQQQVPERGKHADESGRAYGRVPPRPAHGDEEHTQRYLIAGRYQGGPGMCV